MVNQAVTRAPSGRPPYSGFIQNTASPNALRHAKSRAIGIVGLTLCQCKMQKAIAASRRAVQSSGFVRSSPPTWPTNSGAPFSTTLRAWARSSIASPSTATPSMSTPILGAIRRLSDPQEPRRNLRRKPDIGPAVAATSPRSALELMPRFLRIGMPDNRALPCGLQGVATLNQ